MREAVWAGFCRRLIIDGQLRFGLYSISGRQLLTGLRRRRARGCTLGVHR